MIYKIRYLANKIVHSKTFLSLEANLNEIYPILVLLISVDFLEHLLPVYLHKVF